MTILGWLGVGVSLGPQPWPPPTLQSHLPQVRKGLRPEGGRGQDRSWGRGNWGQQRYSKLATPYPLCFRLPSPTPLPAAASPPPPADPLARTRAPGAESGTLGHSRQGLPQRSRGTPWRRGRVPAGPRKPMALSAPWLGESMTKGSVPTQCLVCLAIESRQTGYCPPPLLLFSSQEGMGGGDPTAGAAPLAESSPVPGPMPITQAEQGWPGGAVCAPAKAAPCTVLMGTVTRPPPDSQGASGSLLRPLPSPLVQGQGCLMQIGSLPPPTAPDSYLASPPNPSTRGSGIQQAQSSSPSTS